MGYFRNYEEVKTYLYSLKHHGSKYGIDRMILLSEQIGHPERAFPVIHVAGTNGKGSTCAMLEAIYASSGLKTGMFTSPHLVFQGERIQINREILDYPSIVEYTEKLKVVADRIVSLNPDDRPSFFEFMTAMAFLRFASEKVGVGIIETGLGGRLDASNIVDPLVSVITSVGIDHCEQLGYTIDEILFEKAGIIKAGRPVVIGCVNQHVESELRRIARSRGAAAVSVRERFGTSLKDYPATNLSGDYQRHNAATAWLVAEVLQKRIPIDPTRARAALKSVRWPGRWDERRIGSKRVILDATHNAGGAAWLTRELGELREREGRRPVVVFGTTGKTRAHTLVPTIAEFAREFYMVKVAQPRAASLEELKQEVPIDFPGNVHLCSVHELFPFPGCCAAGDEGDTVVVTGSIYLIGEVMETLYYETPVGEGILH